MGFCKKVGFERVVARGLLLRLWYVVGILEVGV